MNIVSKRKMKGKKEAARTDILSLNLKSIKDVMRIGKHIELSASENGVEISNFDHSIKLWVASNSNQISLSRNKIGKSLFKQHRNDFLLSDPNMFQSRFYVEYHRLHDPGLKKYYESSSMRNHLMQLNLVTEESDAICSRKEFVEYLRYLERICALDIAKSMRNTVRSIASKN